MHPESLTLPPAPTVAGAPAATKTPAAVARRGPPAELARALRASRADTLLRFDAFDAALPRLAVPRRDHFNPPLWELGHLGWFQEYWIARNPERSRGHRADPDAPRRPPRRPGADALYDSTRVAHGSRWRLPLPDATATRDDLAAQLEATLALLAATTPDDADSLYFHRLSLHHEDMHHEAALMMSQALALPAPADARWRPPRLPPPPPALALPGGHYALGSADAVAAEGAGFAFDNELRAAGHRLDGVTLDAQVLRWAEYLPDVEAGLAPVPRYLRRRRDGAWERLCGDRWQPLDTAEPACHLGRDEATAWCRRAGRRLPTEFEWEAAATSLGAAFRWGDVWEWTASPFAPYPGFAPHPYRDYSAPWFDGRPVLRGGSFLTQPRMKDPRYRNFFAPHRSDVAAGFRTCAA